MSDGPIYISGDSWDFCRKCTKFEDCRGGYCFNCASTGEERLAKRKWYVHVWVGIKHAFARRWMYAGFDFSHAWERLWEIGDYAPKGYYNRQGIKWR